VLAVAKAPRSEIINVLQSASVNLAGLHSIRAHLAASSVTTVSLSAMVVPSESRQCHHSSFDELAACAAMFHGAVRICKVSALLRTRRARSAGVIRSTVDQHALFCSRPATMRLRTETNYQSEREKLNSPTLDEDRDQNVDPDVHGAGHAR